MNKNILLKNIDIDYLKIIDFKKVKIMDNLKKSNNILIMFPNIAWESPYMFWDFACNNNKCYWIFSYKKKV